jgi:hypothetical protein
MSNHNKSEILARAWIEGWNTGKPDDIPLAENFTHSSPFGEVKGREKYLEWVKPLATKNVAALKIIKILGDETEAAVWFEMNTPGGLIRVVDWIKTFNNEIISIASFYDPTNIPGYKNDKYSGK